MASDNDMRMHEETYGRVLNIIKWGTIGCTLVGALVVVLIAT